MCWVAAPPRVNTTSAGEVFRRLRAGDSGEVFRALQKAPAPQQASQQTAHAHRSTPAPVSTRQRAGVTGHPWARTYDYSPYGLTQKLAGDIYRHISGRCHGCHSPPTTELWGINAAGRGFIHGQLHFLTDGQCVFCRLIVKI
jgi:hypothetical protein